MTESFGSVGDLRSALDAGQTSSRGLIEHALERAGAVGERLSVFVDLQNDQALAAADAADARRAAGETHSPLDGIPLVIKDNIVQQGERASCASRILEGYVSPFDSTVVAKLRAAGAVVIGRANMDEFAMGSSTENSAYGPTLNPWDLERSPGGSSGGSAAAVAADIVPLALGSDTGGSIRQPAAFCGVVGMKPTYGRVSRYGLVAFASSLDQIGPIGRSAADCAVLLDAISGHDPQDSTSLPEPALTTASTLTGDISGLTIGLPREYFEAEGADPAVLETVRTAASALEAGGAKLVEVDLPHARYAVAAYYLIATAEASSNLARFDGVRYGRRAEGVANLKELYERTRSEGFGDEVKRRILLGTYVLSAGYYEAYYRKAQKIRTLLRRDFDAAFAGCDVLLTPTTPETAFRLGEKTEDPLTMYLSDIYTVSANLAGLPGVSLPCGLAEGLPVGLQVLGRPMEDATVLRVADAYQRLADHHLARPGDLA
ncbi:MAG: Asp-tRNA(Asn)/Glu-tRNA(Gln) amidotransferase subunit GatA [Deltaproteobacteria bacterium]|nr:Asp-tRNA(Asn)/Glu-tRNA(Gln) amidotransferase subunit GatA [Deltaproteobacteria bacterium]MBW2395844.1 Asp-tRNA(Asn)/Glu-tRNA(Gln) amidotransferase subunit GatA [Deltaproteobacteria bacterium]